MMCMRDRESGGHLFIHYVYESARFLWSCLFSIVGETWMETRSLADSFQIEVQGFGRDKKRRILWSCACLAIVWILWLERNKRIFYGRITDKSLLWDKMVLLASLWAKAAGAFHSISLRDLIRVIGVIS